MTKYNTKMTMNSKLMYLPLKELQHYLTNLEFENEKLKAELTAFSRFNCILENIRRSSNKGFNSLQLIDRNKTCRCNEHLNGHLRRMAQEADIELRVWQEQYDKLMLKTKQDYMSTYDEDNRSSVSLSPLSSAAGMSTPPHESHCLDVESDARSNTSDTNYSLHSNTTAAFGSRSPSFSVSEKSVSDESHKNVFRFSANDSNNKNEYKNRNEKHNYVNNESSVRYIPLSPATTVDESTTSRSSPEVVFQSTTTTTTSATSATTKKELICEWPDCRRVFADEEILTHHRRNHIRKSIYHCEFCSTRLLSKEELDNHMKTHRNPKCDERSPETETTIIVDDDEEDEDQDITAHDMDVLDVENTSEAVNLSNKTHVNNNQNHNDNNSGNKTGLTFQSSLFERLSASAGHLTSGLPLNNNNHVISGDHSPKSVSSAQSLVRADEYKRTRYSGVGRYRCPWPDCGYTPHFLRDLRRHMFKHTGDKKHKCDSPGCDFVSVWKTSLLQHQRKKHFLPTNPMDNRFAL